MSLHSVLSVKLSSTGRTGTLQHGFTEKVPYNHTINPQEVFNKYAAKLDALGLKAIPQSFVYKIRKSDANEDGVEVVGEDS